MKRVLLILIALTFSLVSHSQPRNIRVDANGESLQAVLKGISAQSEYKFAFNSRSVDTSVKITANVESASISEIMDAVLEGTGITYTVVGKQVALQAAEPQPAPTGGTPPCHRYCGR